MPKTLRTFSFPPDIVLAGDGVPDWRAVFGRSAPLHLEVGGGRGSFIEELALSDPASDFAVNELKPKLVEAIVARIRRSGLRNVRVLVGDARRALLRRTAPATFTRVMVNHPDPWPKRRHAARKLLGPEFLHLLATRLVEGGDLIIVSDVHEYLASVRALLEALPGLRNAFGPGGTAAALPGYPRSHYQRKEESLGRTVGFLRFIREGPLPPFEVDVPRPLGVMPGDPDFTALEERLRGEGRRTRGQVGSPRS